MSVIRHSELGLADPEGGRGYGYRRRDVEDVGADGLHRLDRPGGQRLNYALYLSLNLDLDPPSLDSNHTAKHPPSLLSSELSSYRPLRTALLLQLHSQLDTPLDLKPDSRLLKSLELASLSKLLRALPAALRTAMLRSLQVSTHQSFLL